MNLNYSKIKIWNEYNAFWQTELAKLFAVVPINILSEFGGAMFEGELTKTPLEYFVNFSLFSIFGK